MNEARPGRNIAKRRLALAAVSLVLASMVATATPSTAADRLGNPGHGTGWMLTGVPGNGGRDVWFGTHLMIQSGQRTDGLCLDFARFGPSASPALEGDYRTFARTSANPVADRQFAYFASVIGSGVTAAGLDTDIGARNFAAAATAAAWGVGEAVGFEAQTGSGARGIWLDAWLRGDLSFARTSANDPGSNTGAIADLFRQLRIGGGSLGAGQATLTVSGSLVGIGGAPGSIGAQLTVPGGGPVPLVPIRVDYVSNLTGISAGQAFRTNETGAVGPIPVALADPALAGWAILTSALAPDQPILWQSSADATAQRLLTSVTAPTVAPGSLRIQKNSTNAALTVTGTRFEVRAPGGLLVGRLVIGADGFSNTITLPIGTYDIVEVEATPGHTLHAPVQATLTANQLTTVAVTNVANPDLTISTQVSANEAAVGATVTDSVTITGLVGAETATVELELHDLTVNPPTGPIGTPLATFAVAGIGNGTTPGLAAYTVTVAVAGHLLGYRERITAPRTTDWSVLGVTSESFRVPTQIPPNLTISTQVSANEVAVGATVSDTVAISGLIVGETATVELELHDLTANPPTGPVGAPLATFTVAGLGNGPTAGLATYTATAAVTGHTLGYRERIVTTTTATPAAPRSTDWSALGVTSESFSVPRQPTNPTIDTDAQPRIDLTIFSRVSRGAVAVGATVTDTIWVDGLATNETATIEVELYDRSTQPPTLVTRTSRAGVGNGQIDGLTPYTPTAADAGHEFTYRERIVSTTSGRSTDWSSLEIGSEKFWVGEIWLGSQVSVSSASVGTVVTDSVFIHGIGPNETASVELELFDITVDPTGKDRPLVHAKVDGLIDGSFHGLAPFTITARHDGHRLGYRHRLVTTLGRTTDWSELGDPSETIGVGRLAVSTYVSTTLARVGTTVTDDVYIEGLAKDEWATAELQLFDLTVDPKGAGQPIQTFSEPGLVNGNNTALAAFKVPASLHGHRLGYRERIATTAGRSTPWSELGVLNETFVVGDDPCMSGIGDVRQSVVGQTIFDNVIVGGLDASETATVELELYDLTSDPTGTTALARFTLTGVHNGTTPGGEYVVTPGAAGHRLSYRERIATTTTGRSTPWSALGRTTETVSVCSS